MKNINNKKGVELALNTVVVSAIALIVLVVIILIFTGGMGETIDKFKKILYKSSGKADCLVVGTDSALDKDGDGYLDDGDYKVYYKDDKGKKIKLPCKCDYNSDPKDEKASKEHLDITNDNTKKYC
jgi:hypothetical protein